MRGASPGSTTACAICATPRVPSVDHPDLLSVRSPRSASASARTPPCSRVVHAIVIAPLPYAEPERLVRVWEANPAQRIQQATVSPGTLVDLRQRSRTLERVAIFGEREVRLHGSTVETWAARAAAVSPALFDVLSVQPAAGRVFASEDGRTAWRGSHDDVVISYGLWQRQFGGDPAVVGRAIRMDYRWSYTIIGVMPLGFSFPPHTDVSVPLRTARRRRRSSDSSATTARSRRCGEA